MPWYRGVYGGLEMQICQVIVKAWVRVYYWIYQYDVSGPKIAHEA